MDYTKSNKYFQLKKVFRYLTIYGLRRTVVKVKGQYHMNRNFAVLPEGLNESRKDAIVGIIGCGNFAYSNIAYYLKKYHGRVIRSCMDTNINRAASLFQEYKLISFSDRADKIISDPVINLVFIASNHASHADYAIDALNAGKNVHIEKPHVVTTEQLHRLCSTMKEVDGIVSLGFNRPKSDMGLKIRSSLLSQTGPMMLNWFVAGHEISPEHWYFKEEEGGRILGNLCHWTDFVYRLIPHEDRYPIKIIPSRGKKSDCDISVTYVFGDDSIATITFSAKGHTFEGVRERFAAHRGNVLIAMDDFGRLTIENVDKKKIWKPLFRDHGHGAQISESFKLSSGQEKPGYENSVEYVWGTGELFLKTRESLEENKIVIISENREAPQDHIV